MQRLTRHVSVPVLQAKPEVVVDWSKPGLVLSPRSIPVESVVDTLENGDPAEDRPQRHAAGLGRYCHACIVLNLCHEICNTRRKDLRAIAINEWKITKKCI